MKIPMKMLPGVLVLIVLALASAAPASAQSPVCPNNVIVTGTSSVVVIPSTTQNIRICKVTFSVQQGATPADFSLISGTGAACATGTAQVTQVFTGIASVSQVYDHAVDGTVSWRVGPGVGVCFSLSAAPVSASIQIWYGVY